MTKFADEVLRFDFDICSNSRTARCSESLSRRYADTLPHYPLHALSNRRRDRRIPDSAVAVIADPFTNLESGTGIPNCH